MIVTIHQPEHLPWLGFLDKADYSDILVLLDDVQRDAEKETAERWAEEYGLSLGKVDDTGGKAFAVLAKLKESYLRSSKSKSTTLFFTL